MSNQVLGPATARWNDYVGTVAADDADALLNSRSVYELADIDRDRWTILGFDLNVDATAKVSVYALDRAEHGISEQADIHELGRTLGALPVVRFTVPESKVEDFVNDAFRRLSVRLVARDVRDYDLVASDPS